MEVIADLHLHSKYSRAVSQQMILPEIGRWAKTKGIGLVATGDWTHPMWLREIRENLEEAGNGLLKLKIKKTPRLRSVSFALQNEKLKIKDRDEDSGGVEPFFLLSTEIASIYSQGGKGRRIHTLLIAPGLAAAEKINSSLSKRGCNLLSDGRPITGLSVKELADIVLNIEPKAMIIPCHVWTPWFSLYGSKSGFDSLEECFGSLGQYIYAVETGLSSDPMMNWQIKELSNRQIVSFSDAHSGPKLGREATVFELSDLSYEAIRQAIMGKWEVGNRTSNSISYTIEFYPEEGKYHYTGHRSCGVIQSPMETAKQGVNCHVCGKPLTVGVMHRVLQLAKGAMEAMEEKKEMRMSEDKFGVKWVLPPEERPQHRPFVSLVPLAEILAQVLETGVNSQNVLNEYQRLIDNIGTEFEILLKTPMEKLAALASAKISQAIGRVRQRKISVSPGYDGVFGTVSIFGKGGNGPEKREQMSLF